MQISLDLPIDLGQYIFDGLAQKLKVFWIDLFCGAGGTSTGIHQANANAHVVACVNHDKKAIQSHKRNHPNCEHFIEDIRDFKVIMKLKELVERLRREHPGCIINIWASLECTNHSKAKGGLSRKADSRTLANHLTLYQKHLNPDYVMIENVREFLDWGPLRLKEGKNSTDTYSQLAVDKKGKYILVPDKRYLKIFYNEWVDEMRSFGMDYDYALLDSANFGAYTSRLRYFGIFARAGYPIVFPEATHSKKPTPGKEKWKAVKEVLKLDDEGESIFNRKKPLVENTLNRIYHGLVKFKDEGVFRYRNNGGSVDPQEKSKSLQQPMGTILSGNVHCIVKSVFTKQYNSGSDATRCKSINEPIGTLTTENSHAVVSALHISTYNGKPSYMSAEGPAPTLCTKDRVCLVQSNFIDQQYGTGVAASVDLPIGAITTVPKFNIVTVKPWLMDTNFKNIGTDIEQPAPTLLASRRYHYLMNPQYENKGTSINQPCFTLIAKTDKRPPYVMTAENGEGYIVIYDTDSPMTVKIKQFMAEHGIIDVKMRMLHVDEMLRVQGFPDDYILEGTQAEQKKFIGNSVVPLIAQKLIEVNYYSLETYLKAA